MIWAELVSDNMKKWKKEPLPSSSLLFLVNLIY